MNIKMSDVFIGKAASRTIDSEDFKLATSCRLPFLVIEDSDHWCCSSKRHVEAAAIAINSYDENQSLIAKQAEQIKMLRSTLIDTLTVVQGSLSSTIANGVKVLEATKEQS